MTVPTFDLLAESHRARLATIPGGVALDDRTRADLDLDKVFAKIDRTTSTLGRQALYHRLRTDHSGDELADFESLVNVMSTDPQSRERARKALSGLQDAHGYNLWWLCEPGAIEIQTWQVVFPILSALALVSVAVVPISFTPLIGMVILSLLVRSATHRGIMEVTRSFRQLAPVIAAGQALTFLNGANIPAGIRSLGEDVRPLRRLKALSRWANENPLLLSHSANPLAIMLNDFVSVVYEYVSTVLLLDATGVFFAARDVETYRGQLRRVLEATGEVDAAIAVAAYREGQPLWSRPQFTDSGVVSATDLCHPLLEDPTPNSVSFHLGHGVLVTGSNMSGKSTFLRTLGVNAVLAQTINTCLAREYVAPRFHVRSCIGRSDDLSAGKSYYVVEVEALVALIQSSQSNEPHLILLDELFHGTNAVERIAAGDAVLDALIREKGAPKPHLVIAATHDLELIPLLASSYAAYHFGDSIGDEGPVFDHRLKAGTSGTRTALALLRQKGAPADLLARAETTAERLDASRSI
ncbi:MAG: hypothetical protein ABI983_06355 [Acidobacteriota bacterium]